MKELSLLFGLAALLLASCGTAEVRLHTTVRESGDASQEVTVSATGALGGLLEDSLGARAQQEGWHVQVDSQGQTTVLRAQKDFKNGDGLSPIFFDDASGSSEGSLTVAQQNSFLYNRYTMRLPISSNQIAEAVSDRAADSAGQSQELIRSSIAQLMKLTWTVTMPGEIESSNADSVTRDTATWELSLDRLPSEGELYVTSRVRKPGSILILLATVILIGLLALTYLTVARRRYREDHSGHIRIKI